MRILLIIALGLSLGETGLGQPMPSLPKGSKWPQNFRELREIYKSTGLEVKRAVVPKAQGVMAKPDIVYVRRGGRELKLDLFLPKPSKKVASIVVLIHGGGWRKGSRTGEHSKAIWLANRGYVAASVEYRLAGEEKFPAAIHDCKDAVRWMRANAKRFNASPDRIAVCGGSAGAHLAALMAAAGPLAKLEGPNETKGSSAVQAAIVIAGPTETDGERAGEQSRKPDSNYRLFFGGTIDEVRSIYARASPANWISKETPPMLIIGEHSMNSAQAILGKLNKMKIPNETLVLKGGIHGEWNWTPWFSITMNRVDNFLNQHLK
tara:strand:+ start:593 stop:1552 length:960 start_codon:yes stop_codon:yes gene_type:complete